MRPELSGHISDGRHIRQLHTPRHIHHSSTNQSSPIQGWFTRSGYFMWDAEHTAFYLLLMQNRTNWAVSEHAAALGSPSLVSDICSRSCWTQMKPRRVCYITAESALHESRLDMSRHARTHDGGKDPRSQLTSDQTGNSRCGAQKDQRSTWSCGTLLWTPSWISH